MKKATKTLLLMLCAVVLVVSSVLGTVAYLTDTKSVENTFTVGNVTITLQERDLNQETGELNSDALVNTVFDKIKFVPGRVIKKQPVITVGTDSENCYLFVKVEDANAEKKILANGNFTPSTGWTAVGVSYPGWYQYNTIATKTSAPIQVFDNFTCNNELGSSAVAALTGGSIKVTAYAIQAEGFVDEDGGQTAIQQAFTALQTQNTNP